MSAEQAQSLGDLEAELFAVTSDRDGLREQIERLHAQVDERAKDEAMQRAAWVMQTAATASLQLQDVLASLRVELMAASDEFDQYAAELPRASYELIRQALRDASGFAEESRQLVRTLASVDDASDADT
ncbi:MAG: hypothetical protein IPL79_04915 [Myxococcales bacterium]|nr:hypothetical protein [Myxococcales bacterium]